jgi:hypothetical protein
MSAEKVLALTLPSERMEEQTLIDKSTGVN